MIGSIENLEFNPMTGLFKIGKMSLDATVPELQQLHKNEIEQLGVIGGIVKDIFQNVTITHDTPDRTRTIEVTIDNDDDISDDYTPLTSVEVLKRRLDDHTIVWFNTLHSNCCKLIEYIEDFNPTKLDLADMKLFNLVTQLALYLDLGDLIETLNRSSFDKDDPFLRKKAVNEFIQVFERFVYHYTPEYSNRGRRLHNLVKNLMKDLNEIKYDKNNK